MRAALALVLLVAACDGSKSDADGAVSDGDGGGDDLDAATSDPDGGNPPPLDAPPAQCDGPCPPATGPQLAGCPVLPADHVFNTPIDTLPVHPQSAAFIATIGGTRRIHLDLGTTTDQQSGEFYGVPFNIVRGDALAWTTVAYLSTDPDLDWNTRAESDCAIGSGHTLARPCTASAAPAPQGLPIPGDVVVEGGINRAADQQPYGDHHMLLLDADRCVLWETYHSYSPRPGVWNLYGSAQFDLRSNALRPADWSSADAAGLPILPLLLRADEASTGAIEHALRFTIASSKIRRSYVWPARHLTTNGTTSTSLPPMGQLFRLKADFAMPANASTQTRAIVNALKTYGMYLADGGSDMYVTGDPSAAWAGATFSQVQAIAASNFEAVDLTPVMQRSGFDVNSGRVP